MRPTRAYNQTEFYPESEKRRREKHKGGLGNKGPAVIEAKQGPPSQINNKIINTKTVNHGMVLKAEMSEPAHPLDISHRRS